ncbi:MAG TPA: class I SAM-dependent methyltransferase [Herpetosiphonaceae bacterium]
MLDPTKRFSSRVDNYVKYRPGYPPELPGLLAQHCGLAAASVVADIGSGTGLLTEPLLRHGWRVYGVEPNPEMRAAGAALLAGHPGFASVDGTAEATTLPAASIDLIAAGQAFHWFDQEAARAEWRRILRPGGWVALVWNVRADSSPFQRDYERLLREQAPEYGQVNHRNVDAEALAGFFRPGPVKRLDLANQQRFDLPGLKGRVLSSSYAPEPGHPRHEPLMAGLERLFERYQEDGAVAFDYETEIYLGQLGAD